MENGKPFMRGTFILNLRQKNTNLACLIEAAVAEKLVVLYSLTLSLLFNV